MATPSPAKAVAAPPGSARAVPPSSSARTARTRQLLEYTAHAQVGGKLAQIGSRLIDGTARKMADDFFAKFTQVVGQPQDGADGADSEAETPARQEASAPGGQFAAQPAAAMALSPAAPAAVPAEAGGPPVDMRLVAMVGAATVAFIAILFMVAGG